MPRLSRIDQMPADIRDAIARKREAGHTIDQILAHLEALGVPPEEMPSRSGLGRKIQSIDRVLEMVRSSRGMTEALVERLGEAKEGRAARANIELMQALVMQLLAAAASEESDVLLSAKEAALVAKALADLSRAQKTDMENTIRLKREMAAEMEKKLAELGDEAKAAARPPTPDEMIARIRALYVGEG